MQLACRPSDFQSLTGLRVLLAENEVVIALDLELMLQRLGCTVCQVTSSIDQTLQQLQEERPDAVILNPRLNDGSALPVAEVLRREQIPFVLVKDGPTDALIEPVWKEAPRLERPYGSSRLGQVLMTLAENDQAPVRFAAGSDAYSMSLKKIEILSAQAEQFKELSAATDGETAK